MVCECNCDPTVNIDSSSQLLPFFTGNPGSGCMCADAEATLRHAAGVCDGQGSCVLLAVPFGTARLEDNVCNGFSGCNFVCPNSTGACDGAEAAVSLR